MQLTTILETRKVEKCAATAGSKIDLDLTKEFVQQLGTQMTEELSLTKLRTAKSISKKMNMDSKTVYSWLKEPKTN